LLCKHWLTLLGAELMRVFLLTFAMLAVVGCMQQPVEPEPEPEPVFVPQGDTCGAGGLSGLIGASKSAVEARSFDQPVRIIAPGSAVTMDFNPKRLNFLISDNEVIEITCG
jgi:hypothetical protein